MRANAAAIAGLLVDAVPLWTELAAEIGRGTSFATKVASIFTKPKQHCVQPKAISRFGDGTASLRRC
jgi:hypothetical protein